MCPLLLLLLGGRYWQESLAQLYYFEPQHYANVVWAAARLGLRPPAEWRERLFLVTYRQLASFAPRELAGEASVRGDLVGS
jgi:hypothetical protein